MNAHDYRSKIDAEYPRSSALPQPLDPLEVRRYLRYCNVPEVRVLAQEVLRLQLMIKRLNVFFSTASRSGVPDALDITSRNLAAGLIEALAREPGLPDPHPLHPSPPPLHEHDQQARVSASGQAERLPAVHSIQATQLPMQRAQHQKLFTWKLTPERGRFSDKWEHSSYRGTVFVRAQDALQARQLAAQRFSAGGELKDSPWVSRGLVIGVRVNEAAYERIDTVSILYP